MADHLCLVTIEYQHRAKGPVPVAKVSPFTAKPFVPGEEYFWCSSHLRYSRVVVTKAMLEELRVGREALGD